MRLYRRRYIPDETIMLNDDVLFVSDDEKMIVTRWSVLRPRTDDVRGGYSCYLFDKNVKISAFLDKNGAFLYWYCDIIDAVRQGDDIVVRDLLADVVVFPDGNFRVLDLDELADAAQSGLITEGDVLTSLRATSRLLNDLYEHRFASHVVALENFMPRVTYV